MPVQYNRFENGSVTKVSFNRVTFVAEIARLSTDNDAVSNQLPPTLSSEWEDDNEPMRVEFAKEAERKSSSVFRQVNPRLPLLALAILALLAAMWGGLLRIGWEFPPVIQILPAVHGPLMITGFLGTLISLERAVALQKHWAFTAPVLNAFGILALIINVESHFGILVATLGSIVLLVVFGVILNRHLALFTGTMALGVVVWVLGNLLWLGDSLVSHVTHWWAGFLILTIVGERLELSRIQRLPQRATTMYAIAIGIFLFGLVTDAAEGLVRANSDIGAKIIGLGMLVIAVWLARYDIARRTVRQQGLTRFIAFCLLLGYGWLGVSGILRIIYGGVSGGFFYDAILHTLFLGFVISMIFGHAPIIFPSILGRSLNYRPVFYAHLILLHLSLALRVAGDFVWSMSLRQWGAMLNAIAILLFLFTTVSTILLGLRQPRGNKNAQAI